MDSEIELKDPPRSSYQRLSYDQRVGLNVAIARERLGLSQRELGWRVHLSQSTICRIEKGQMQIRAADLAAIAKALNHPREELEG